MHVERGVHYCTVLITHSRTQLGVTPHHSELIMSSFEFSLHNKFM